MPKEVMLPTVPMNDSEKEFLMHIYSTRRSYFFPVYAIILASVLAASLKAYSVDMSDTYDYEILWHELTRDELFFLLAIPFVSLVILSGVLIYRKRILAYKKDVQLGQKEEVRYTVIRKQYFQHTDQYFLSFDNPKYMHYQVDYHEYMSCNVGDTYAIYRGVYSKQVFEKNGRYTFM